MVVLPDGELAAGGFEPIDQPYLGPPRERHPDYPAVRWFNWRKGRRGPGEWTAE